MVGRARITGAGHKRGGSTPNRKSARSCASCGVGVVKTAAGASKCHECLAAYKREWRRDHAAQHRLNQELWRAMNPDKLREYARRNYERHSERMKKQAMAWGKKNKAKRSLIMAFQNAKRRSRKAANGGRGFTKDHWRLVVKRFDGLCCYCRISRVGSIDHFHPLSLGGQDDFTNIVPACPQCNSRKGPREPRQWVIAIFGVRRLKWILARMLTA